MIQKMYLIAGLKVVACRNSVDIVQICLMYTQGCDCGYLQVVRAAGALPDRESEA